MQNVIIKNIRIALLLLLAHRSQLALTQRLSTEEQKCTQYKKDVFEVTTVFSAFVYDAPDMVYITDYCKEYAPFVVGGAPASPKEFPHVARLGHAAATAEAGDSRGRRNGNSTTKWFCGGTLISEKFVLTAAHCLNSNYGVVNKVRLGELDFSSETDDAQPEDFGVKRFIEHPDYSDALYNDIGLIELDRAVNFTRNTYKHPACLPLANGDEFNEFIAVGWGSTRFGSMGSEQLLKVKLDRFGYDRCRTFSEDVDRVRLSLGIQDKIQLCAGSTKQRDTCQGDSGGPLLAYHKDYPCMYFVVGVTSAGLGGCGTPNVPGIYTRVFNYIDWIRPIVWGNQSN